MSSYIGLQRTRFPHIVETAKGMNYREDNILILQGNEKKLQNKYPSVWKNILTCSHNMDKRTPLEYAQDLVSNWLLEDFIISKLNKFGYNAYCSGKDKERKILKNDKVGTEPDITIEKDGKTYPLELCANYDGYWTRLNKIDLRDSKYNNMVANNDILVAISFKDRQFAVIDITNYKNITKEEHHAQWGGKPCWTIHTDNCFVDITEKNIKEQVDKIFS